MERFIKGDVVIINFPFSDLSSSKKRPAVILADIKGDDFLMVQITSQGIKDEYALPLANKDFKTGNLKTDSNIRPNKLFTLDKSLISYQIGHLHDNKINEVVTAVIEIIKN